MGLKELLNGLAEIEHEQWMTWATSVIGEVSLKRAARWDKEYMKPYEELSEEVKELDRKWARKVIVCVLGNVVSKRGKEK